MLAKLTSKNQLTLPRAVTAAVEATRYFEVTTENGRIVLTPVRTSRADGVRAKLAKSGISETDLTDAVGWARSGESRRSGQFRRQTPVSDQITSSPARRSR